MVAPLPTPLEPSARRHGRRRRALFSHGRTKALIGLAVAATVSAAGLVALGGTANAATQICEKYGSTTVGGRYVVMNNNWGDDTTQCITVNDNGFQITTASHNRPTNGAPGSYPAIYAGCHYANCSPGTTLPIAVSSSAFSTATTSVSMSYPGSGQWDAAYDIWFDPTARRDGQNTGAELMIWMNHMGAPQPVGSRVGTVTLAGGTWDVWFGNIGWNVVSYVRTSATSSMNFAIRNFYDDMVNRGYAQRSWYLTSVQAGFEPWTGQTGLAVNSFSFSTSGTVPTTPVPTTPVPTTPNPTGGGGCTASYSTLNAWSGGFTGQITVRASGAINGWRVSWPLASGQTLNNVWGGRSSTSGSTVTVTNETWNGSLAAGGTTTVGFNASGTPSSPSVTCTAS